MLKNNFRTIHTADWHFWDRHKFSINDSRLEDIKNNAIEIVTFAIKKKIDMIIVCGDVVNVFNPNEKTLKALAEIIEYAISNGVMLRLIMGDHDTDGETYSLESLKKVYDVKHDFYLKIYPAVVNKEMIYTEKIKGNNIVYVPYQKNMQNVLLDAKKKKLKGYKNLLFTHVGINAAYFSGLKAIKSKTEIKIKIIDGWDYVGLGDYHLHQKIKSNIYYSGSIIRINSGERKDVKGFNVVRFIDGELKVSKIKLNDIEFVEYYINYNKIQELMLEAKDNDYKNSIVDVYIYGDIGSGSKLVDLRNMLMKNGALDVRDKIVGSKVEKIKNKKISLSLNPSEAVEKYLNLEKVKSKKQKRYGIKIISEL